MYYKSKRIIRLSIAILVIGILSSVGWLIKADVVIAGAAFLSTILTSAIIYALGNIMMYNEIQIDLLWKLNGDD